MMIAMAVDPANRIHINADGVVEQDNRLDEPELIVQRSVRYAHMDHVRQIDAGKKPDAENVKESDTQTFPGA